MTVKILVSRRALRFAVSGVHAAALGTLHQRGRTPNHLKTLPVFILPTKAGVTIGREGHTTRYVPGERLDLAKQAQGFDVPARPLLAALAALRAKKVVLTLEDGMARVEMERETEMVI